MDMFRWASLVVMAAWWIAWWTWDAARERRAAAALVRPVELEARASAEAEVADDHRWTALDDHQVARLLGETSR
jgi:hypothetical protein